MKGRFIATLEDALAIEELTETRAKAEGAPTQLYERYTENTQKLAIAERQLDVEEDEAEGGGEFSDDFSDDSQETQTEEISSDGDEELTDTIETDEEEEGDEPTLEALHEWISDKTKYSESSVVRNAGALAAGLSRIGVNYGPGLIGAVYKGVLWAFSRIGMVIYDSAVWLKAYHEKSKLSLDKLDARLKAVESSLTASLNGEKAVPPYAYTNQKVISMLKIGKSLDIGNNLRIQASGLQAACNTLGHQAETGVRVLEKMAAASKDARNISIESLMKIGDPGGNFRSGTLPGYEAYEREDHAKVYHTEPTWPGDMSLLFVAPHVTSSKEDQINSAYHSAKIFVAAVLKDQEESVSSMPSLTAAQLVMLCKSTRGLLVACSDVSKGHEKLLKLSPSALASAKKLFYEMADNKAKKDMDRSLIIPFNIRAKYACDTVAHGSANALSHASRVLSAAIQLLEDHAKKLAAAA